jgi:DNA invertase Pin-like site-specific DNA recombinase/cell division protein FtsB
MKYFVYCRKSEDDEDRQILSLESQKRELEKLFYNREGITIVDVYEEAMSAKLPGRPLFNEMIQRVERGEAEGLIAWTPNRLARNSVDSGWIIYLLDRGVLKDLKFCTCSFENTPQGKFMLQIMFAESKHYSDALSVSIRRGNRTKVENGWIPGRPPLGYLNNRDTRTVVKDPVRFQLVRRMWDLMLSGSYSPKRIWQIAAEEWGLRTRKSKRRGGGPLVLSAVYRMFTNPFYAGVIRWEDNVYQGKHESMVTLDEYDRVQELLGLRSKPRAKAHDFAYTGMIRCGECELMVTAEEHVNRQGHHYTYYRCTKKRVGYRCRQPFVSLSILEQQILRFLEEISIPATLHRWALSKLDRAASERTTDLAAEHRSLEQAQAAARRELDNLTTLRLRDLLTDHEFVAKRQELRREELRLGQNMARLENGASWLEPARLALSLSKDGPILFRNANNTKKRAILEIVGSNLTLTDKSLTIDAKKPFRRWGNTPDHSQMWRLVEDVRTLAGTTELADFIRAAHAILDHEIHSKSDADDTLSQAA